MRSSSFSMAAPTTMSLTAASASIRIRIPLRSLEFSRTTIRRSSATPAEVWSASSPNPAPTVFTARFYDYLRNDDLNANLYFNNAAAATNPGGQANPRPILKRNQFGGTLGGPVTIPHV